MCGGAGSTLLSPANFFVQYNASCDGGVQERDAAANIIREVFPNANVYAGLHETKPNTVVVNVGTPQYHAPVVSVPQRDLYKKYKHPARPVILNALREMVEKEDSSSTAPLLL